MKIQIEQLNTSTKTLKQKWELTKDSWNDSVSQDFEKTFIMPLFDQLRHTQRELERLGQVIAQIKRNVR